MLDDEQPGKVKPIEETINHINMPVGLIAFTRFWQETIRDRVICSVHHNFAGNCFELHNPGVNIGEPTY
jgi:hypothetical protein